MIVGFILVHVSVERGTTQAYVVTLDVAPGYRRQGLARGLLEDSEREALNQGALQVALHVWTANLPAVCFYERAGYTRKKIHRDLYAPGVDAYDYVKLLVAGTA